MTMTLDHCLICYRGGVTVTGGGNSGSLPENGNTCGRPFKVIRHYLTLNSDHFNPEEIANTKQQLFEEQVCDVCSPLVTSFSELYGQWRRLQLEMNLKLEQMEDMMVKADDEANIEFSSYRKCFQEKLMQSSITLENFTGFRDDLKRKVANKIKEVSLHPRLAMDKLAIQRPAKVDIEDLGYTNVDHEVEQGQLEEAYSSPPGTPMSPTDDVDISSGLLVPEPETVEEGHVPEILQCEPSTSKRSPVVKREIKKKAVFMCTFCNKSFFRYCHLVIHIRLHTMEKPHICRYPDCGASFSRTTTLNDHHRIHTGNKTFYGNICGKQFRELFELKLHGLVIQERKPKLKCVLCSKSFLGEGSLRAHEHRVHGFRSEAETIASQPGRTPSELDDSRCNEAVPPTDSKQAEICSQTQHLNKRVCSACNKVYSSTMGLRRHLLTHTKEKPFQCSFCVKGFINQNALIAHERRHTGDRPFKCEVCGQGFTSKPYLVAHKLIHTVETTFKCRIGCGKAFTTYANRYSHERRQTCCAPKPIEDLGLLCKLCGRSFAQPWTLKLHLRRCTTGEPDTRVRSHECTVCGKKYLTRDGLRQHKRLHSQEKTHKCQTCDKKFLTTYELRTHERRHSDLKAFTCEQCGKSFVLRERLRNHQLSHLDNSNKIYKCGYCDKRFHKLNKRRQHERTHTGEKPFSCDLCGRSFRVNQQLKAHEALHNPEHKPFSCEFCDKKFARKCYLRDHMKRLHKAEFEECN